MKKNPEPLVRHAVIVDGLPFAGKTDTCRHVRIMLNTPYHPDDLLGSALVIIALRNEIPLSTPEKVIGHLKTMCLEVSCNDQIYMDDVNETDCFRMPVIQAAGRDLARCRVFQKQVNQLRFAPQEKVRVDIVERTFNNLSEHGDCKLHHFFLDLNPHLRAEAMLGCLRQGGKQGVTLRSALKEIRRLDERLLESRPHIFFERPWHIDMAGLDPKGAAAAIVDHCRTRARYIPQ